MSNFGFVTLVASHHLGFDYNPEGNDHLSNLLMLLFHLINSVAFCSSCL